MGCFSAAQITALKAGSVYANVHSVAFPGGEIRGQVVESTTTRYMTTLSGATLQSSFYYLDPGAIGIGLASSNAMRFMVQ